MSKFFIKNKNGSKRQTSNQKFRKLNKPNMAINKSSGNKPSTSVSGTSKTDGFFINKDDNRDDQCSKSTHVEKQFHKKPTRTPTEKLQNSNPDKTTKKPFDKKKWRLQKYSKKYKLEQWEERRKKNLLSEYHKQVEDEPKFNVQEIYDKYEDDEDVDNDNKHNSNITVDLNLAGSSSGSTAPSNTTNFVSLRKKNANEEFISKQELKKQRKEEIEKKRAEKIEAMKAYKQKKLEKYKKLSKKTHKGQPIMKYRMEMLLEEIQKSIQ